MESIDYKTGSFLKKPNALEIFNSDYVPPDLQVVLKVQEWIELEFREHKDPEYYAAKLNRPLRSLNVLCVHYLEQTVYGMIQERIHVEALQLLRHTTLTAKQIAYEIGSSTPSYFSRCFKLRTGLSPKEWRKAQKM